MDDLYIEFCLKTEESDNGCINWCAALHKSGYGALGISKWGDSYAHRWSYKYHHGEIPNKKVVRHKCDNRKCVNPDHLELGDPADNVRDMWIRNPKAGNRKVSDAQVLTIFEMNARGCTKKEISKQIGVSIVQVYRILDRKTSYQSATAAT